MKQIQRKQNVHASTIVLLLIILCIFAVACFPRLLSLDAHWSSDEARWLYRSAQFMSAIKDGKFSETLISYHPGVTTMWIAGLRTFFITPHVDLENLARARWLIGIAIWVGIGVTCLLLYQLFGRWVALLGFVCLTYSPFFLAQTRRVHTDALAATFILTTVLLFLLYCQNRRSRYLVFSGLAFGLAILSKSYALILLLWVPICLILFPNRGKQKINFWVYIAEILCFMNCTVFLLFALWPIFWTPLFGLIMLCLAVLTVGLLKGILEGHNPIILIAAAITGLGLFCIFVVKTVWNVFERVNWAVTTPHEVEHFFLGKVVNDPGWLFYPLVLTIKSTPLMLPLAVIGLFLLWKARKNSIAATNQYRMVLALFVGVLLFTVCLSATSKKFSRYLMPAIVMLEILCAIGFVEVLKGCYFSFRSRFAIREPDRYKETFTIFLCIIYFIIQILPVLTLHPYYGTYYNLCWKVLDITRIITVGEASGLDIAANYLNQKHKDAFQLRVQVSPLATEFVRHYFQGYVYRADRSFGRIPNYEIVYIRDSQIGRVPQPGTLNGELETVVTLNGIDHVWIYRIQ